MARILIADDAPIARAMLRRLLEQMGHCVVGEAENGKKPWSGIWRYIRTWWS